MRKKLTRRKLTLSEKIGIKEVIGNFKLNNESEFILLACSLEITFYLLLCCRLYRFAARATAESEQEQTKTAGAWCSRHNVVWECSQYVRCLASPQVCVKQPNYTRSTKCSVGYLSRLERYSRQQRHTIHRLVRVLALICISSTVRKLRYEFGCNYTVT